MMSLTRWLIARSRMDEAKEILYQAAKKNGKNIEKDQIILQVQPQHN